MNRLRAGVALYNTGQYLAAHEPLEELWLEAPADERDDCVQGLIQASAAIYKSRAGNETGAIGLAESAIEYLTDCDESPVAIAPLVGWLERFAADPDLGRRETPPKLRLGGEAVGLYDLSPAELIAAAEAVAETNGDELLVRAVEYAESDIKGGRETSPFVTLTLDYIREPNPIVGQRLREHVERRRSRESDVEGLFK